MRFCAMRRAVTRDIPAERVSSSEWEWGRSIFREKVDRVGDFTKLELTERAGPWPSENVERAGEGGMLGRLWEVGIPL
jgi:hypothetical protein